MRQIDRSMLQYSHSSELFAVLFVYIDKEQLDKLQFVGGEYEKNNWPTSSFWLRFQSDWMWNFIGCKDRVISRLTVNRARSKRAVDR